MTNRILLLIVTLLLLSLPASAIPNIKDCSSYVVYATGFVPNSQIAAENFPNPVNNNTASISAGGRCYSLWTSDSGKCSPKRGSASGTGGEAETNAQGGM